MSDFNIKFSELNVVLPTSELITVKDIDYVYKVAGKILEAIQDLEHWYKRLCRTKNLELQDDNTQQKENYKEVCNSVLW